MSITTLTSREFNQDTGRAKKAAENGPVFITDRGKPAHVLMSILEYKRLAGLGEKISDLLAFAGAEDIELDLPRRRELARRADLT